MFVVIGDIELLSIYDKVKSAHVGNVIVMIVKYNHYNKFLSFGILKFGMTQDMFSHIEIQYDGEKGKQCKITQ